MLKCFFVVVVFFACCHLRSWDTLGLCRGKIQGIWVVKLPWALWGNIFHWPSETLLLFNQQHNGSKCFSIISLGPIYVSMFYELKWFEMALCSGNKHINKMQRKFSFSVFLFNVYLGRKRNTIVCFEECILIPQLYPWSTSRDNYILELLLLLLHDRVIHFRI